ncbi:hypothetical protein [Streptomyces beihaiensis]|uniref:Uncharacterized protein n=1 Tax=Streptomyces beihaiensis TaxID=2984495 RepID=A0ABT3TWC6_9ACTN|nr:hypothetical protein [Streptomyces beihaiensis]MCX3061341.1 hypothetical protein [Streptomyces beihaiensis]
MTSGLIVLTFQNKPVHPVLPFRHPVDLPQEGIPMSHLPIVRQGERVVARSDGKGGLILGVEKIQGREFATSAECNGYVLDARLLMDALGGLKMPGSWFQVWCKLVAAQNGTRTDVDKRTAPRGFVRMTQRDLQARCALSAASVNEASQFFMHIGWIRSAKRGILQLNPWLTVAGTSGEQTKWQQMWNEADGPACIIPAPDYPAEWRTMRAAEKKRIETARRQDKVVTLHHRKPRSRQASA